MTLAAEFDRARRAAKTAREAAAKELRTNPRAMVGACVLGVLAALSITIQLSSWAEGRLGDARQYRIEAEALREASMLDAEVFAEAAASFEARLASAQDQFWTGDAASVAQADLRQWLARSAAQAGMGGLRLEGGEILPVAALPGVQEITIQARSDPLDTSVTSASVRALLSEIVAEPRYVRVSVLDVAFDPSPQLRLAVSAYFAPEGWEGAP